MHIFMELQMQNWPREMKTLIHKDWYRIQALFLTPQTGRKTTATGKWMSTFWYMYIKEYYLVIKNNYWCTQPQDTYKVYYI